MVLRVLFECKTGVSQDYGLMYSNPGPSFGRQMKGDDEWISKT